MQMNRQNEEMIKIRDKTRMELIDEKIDQAIVIISRKIIFNQIFEYFYLAVIVSNSIFLAMDDSTNTQTPTFKETLDTFYSALYFIEFFLKIFGLGFIFGKGAYLRDYWNILDFLVVLQMASQLIVDTNFNLSVLRAFRVLRPLRTITSIEGLKILVSALISALPLLRDTIIILLFFFFVFAIAALQVFSGDLQNRCFEYETGLLHKDDLLCGKTTSCPPGYICGQRRMNPDLGITNFDNIFYSLLTIFQCITLEGWSLVMIMLMKSTHYMVFLIFIPLVFIGAYFLLNLTLAVINYKFTEAHKYHTEKKRLELARNLKQNFDNPGQTRSLIISKLQQNKHNSLNDDSQHQQGVDSQTSDKSGTSHHNAHLSMSLTIQKYIIAKKAAKNMILFLRNAQQIRREIDKQNSFSYRLKKRICSIKIQWCRKRQKIYQMERTKAKNDIEYVDAFKFGNEISKSASLSNSVINDQSFIYLNRQQKEIQNTQSPLQLKMANKAQLEKNQFNLSVSYDQNQLQNQCIHSSQKDKSFLSKSSSQDIPIKSRTQIKPKKKLIILEENLQGYTLGNQQDDEQAFEDSFFQNIDIQRPFTQNFGRNRRNNHNLMIKNKNNSSHSFSNRNIQQNIGNAPFQSPTKKLLAPSHLQIKNFGYENQLSPQKQNRNTQQNQQQTEYGIDFYNSRPHSDRQGKDHRSSKSYQSSNNSDSSSYDQGINGIKQLKAEDRDGFSRRLREFEFETVVIDDNEELKNNAHQQNQDSQFHDEQNDQTNIYDDKFISEKSLVSLEDKLIKPQQRKNRKDLPQFYECKSSISSKIKSSRSFKEDIDEHGFREYIGDNNIQISKKIFFQKKGSMVNKQKLDLIKQQTQNSKLTKQLTDYQMNYANQSTNLLNQNSTTNLSHGVETSLQQSNVPQQTRNQQNYLQPLEILKKQTYESSMFYIQSPLQLDKKSNLVQNNLSNDEQNKHNQSENQLAIQEEIKKDEQHEEVKEIPIKVKKIEIKKDLNLLKRKSTIVFRKVKKGGVQQNDNEDDIIEITGLQRSKTMMKKKSKDTIFDSIAKSQQNQKQNSQKQKVQLSSLINNSQKIMLNDKKPEYFSSSHTDVLLPRLQDKSKVPSSNINKREKGDDQDFPDPNRYRPGIIKASCAPYKQRVIYQVKEDLIGSEIINMLLENEEFKSLQEQPYETVTQIGFKDKFDNESIRSVAYISDLYITSTLSFTVLPKKKSVRLYEQVVDEDALSKAIDIPEEFYESQQRRILPVHQDIAIIQEEQEIVESASSFNSQTSNSEIKTPQLNSSSLNNNEQSKNSKDHNNPNNNVDDASKDLMLFKQNNDIFSSENSLKLRILHTPEHKPKYSQQNSMLLSSSPFHISNLNYGPKELNNTHKNNQQVNNFSELQSNLFSNNIKVNYLEIPQTIHSKSNSPIFHDSKNIQKQSLNSSLISSIRKKSETMKLDSHNGSPSRIKEIMGYANLISAGKKLSLNELSVGLKQNTQIQKYQQKHHKSLVTNQNLRKKIYKSKDIERKKEKLVQINLQTAKDFFEGKFYSSDEEEFCDQSYNQQSGNRRRNSIKTIQSNMNNLGTTYNLQTDGALNTNNSHLTHTNLITFNIQNNPVNFNSIEHGSNFIVDRSMKQIIKIKALDDQKDIDKATKQLDNEEILSDVPSSLYSDFECIKNNRSSENFNNNHSKVFAQMINQVQKISHQRYIDFLLLRKKDLSKAKQYSRWSGQDVLGNLISDQKAKEVVKILNNIRVWPKGYGFIQVFRKNLKNCVKHGFFENLMVLCVIINTIILALDRPSTDDDDSDNDFGILLANFNAAFTYIFCIELIAKLTGMGIKNYIKDKMNYLDSGVVLLSIIEIAFNYQSSSPNSQQSIGKSSLSAFRVVRIFRTFRVLRVARLLRQFRSMQIIIGVIQRSIKSFIYIAMLLFLFIYIYALLGMTLFGDEEKHEVGVSFSNGNHGPLSRGGYDNFHNAFITVFQVLTMENWQYVMYDTMYYTKLNNSIIALYYISWIFIGNFILLNLFLAILLDSFLVEEEEEQEINKQEEEKLKQLENKEEKQKQRQKPNEKNNRVQSLANIRRKTIKPLQNLIQAIKNQHTDKSSSQIYTPTILIDIPKENNNQLQNLEDLDADEKMKIILNLGISNTKKRTQLFTLKSQIYKDIHCQNSLYLFSQNNKFRLNLVKIVKHRYFERIIILVIIISSVKLAFDTYFLNDESKESLLIDIDIFFTVVFFIEAVVKILAFGFVIDKGSYLRESWNILDFFIVFSQLIDLFITDINIPSLKILRLLRTLRPLRFITHNSGIKTIVIALLESIGAIINVLIVVLIIWLMFGILGVSLFGGKSYYCSSDIYINHTKAKCLKNGGEWRKYSSNFDDIGNAMITLFVVSSLENWNEIMYQAVDGTSINRGPALNSNPEAAYYFVVFILIGSFFFLNFFIGVLFLNYKLAQRKLASLDNNSDPNFNNDILTVQQNTKFHVWKDIQSLILKASPDFETTNIPKSIWRKKVHSVVSSNKFDIFIMVCILLNMVLMACIYEGAKVEFVEMLDNINIAFTILFTLEAILKLIGYGGSYFQNGWNIFDFVIIFMSYAEIIIDQSQDDTFEGILRNAPQLVRVLRVLRISRIMRLINKYKGLQALISTIMFSLPPLMNVFSLLMIIFFIFAVLGVFMFGQVEKGQIIDDQYMNFRNFGQAMLMLFRISTGEDWNYVMYDTMNQSNCMFQTDCVTPYAPLYFISFVLICTDVMLNLFVLIILQQFDKYYLPPDNVIAKFKKDLQSFKDTWKIFTIDKYNCQKIKESQLIQFMKKLKEPLGMSNTKEEIDVIQELLKMNITTENGFIYFNQMLYRCMKRVYGDMLLNREMIAFEIRTQLKIQEQTLNKERKSKLLFSENLKKVAITTILKPQNNFNPIFTTIYLRIVFQAWLQQGITSRVNNDDKEINERQEFEILYDSCEEMLIEEESEASSESSSGSELEQSDSEESKSNNNTNQDLIMRSMQRRQNKLQNQEIVKRVVQFSTNRFNKRQTQDNNKIHALKIKIISPRKSISQREKRDSILKIDQPIEFLGLLNVPITEEGDELQVKSYSSQIDQQESQSSIQDQLSSEYYQNMKVPSSFSDNQSNSLKMNRISTPQMIQSLRPQQNLRGPDFLIQKQGVKRSSNNIVENKVDVIEEVDEPLSGTVIKKKKKHQKHLLHNY